MRHTTELSHLGGKGTGVFLCLQPLSHWFRAEGWKVASAPWCLAPSGSVGKAVLVLCAAFQQGAADAGVGGKNALEPGVPEAGEGIQGERGKNAIFLSYALKYFLDWNLFVSKYVIFFLSQAPATPYPKH